MRAAFAYLGRGSWLARRDPRSILLAAFFFVLAAPQIRDSRQLLIVAALALGYYLLAGIPWAAVRRQWLYLLIVIGAVATINALITGGQAGDFREQETHVLITLPLGIEVTAEGISLIVTQLLRFIAIAAVGFPVAYAIAPGDLGPALHQLRLGNRLPVMVDLTVRFIPTLSEEFGETIDAQRVRGFDPLQRGGSPMVRLRRLAPVFVPVTVGSLSGAEDTIDAMDLRGFGTGQRTWFRHLRMDRDSWLVVAAFVAFFLTATFLNVTGRSEHYLLPFLVS